jgi:hypothetical protein
MTRFWYIIALPIDTGGDHMTAVTDMTGFLTLL